MDWGIVADPGSINLGWLFLSEFLGTMVLIILGLGVNAGVSLKKTHSENSGWIVITAGWAFAVMAGAYVATYSGGSLNPAVSLANLILGAWGWAEFGIGVLAEFLGAMVGAAIIAFIYWDHFVATSKETKDVGGVFFTGPAIKNNVRNYTTEAIGTFILVFAIIAPTTFGSHEVIPSAADMNAAAAAGTEIVPVYDQGIGLPGWIGPIWAGIVVFAIGLSLGGLTGYAINPARDIGPRIVHTLLPLKDKGSSNWSYSWIPATAPLVGAAIAAGMYNIPMA